MGHKIILNRQTAPTFSSSVSAPEDNSPNYSFSYAPDHSLTPAQSGAQFAKIQRLLERAVAVAGDHEHEE